MSLVRSARACWQVTDESPFRLFDLCPLAARRRGDRSRPASLARACTDLGLFVVLEELYAGVSSRDHRIVERIELEFERVNRMLVPNQRDWNRAGHLLNRIANKYGYESIGRSRLTNDAVIAASAARSGVEVITSNARDFSRLAEFCPLQWRVG